MTATQKIKRELLKEAIDAGEVEYTEFITEENIDILYEELLVENELHWDAESEFRCSGEETSDITKEWSRNYEAKGVARQLSTGEWVGWTYWYGGGKHGDPGGIPWMEDAYDLYCVETEEVVTVRRFSLS